VALVPTGGCYAGFEALGLHNKGLCQPSTTPLYVTKMRRVSTCERDRRPAIQIVTTKSRSLPRASPADDAIRRLHHERSLRSPWMASGPAEVHGAIYLGAASVDDDGSVEDCPGAEGRCPSEVELPPHSALSGGVRGRFHGAGPPARPPTSAKPAVCGRGRPYGVALRPDSGERTCGWDRRLGSGTME
jgi:hypothetical protein